MYDVRSLKPAISITPDTVECPVLGCARIVERQRGTFRREETFRCAEHGIYISASTFEYDHPHTNLLAMDAEDFGLFARLTGAKAESGRLGRERSEDAVTFNVIRGLEREGQLDAVFSALLARPIQDAVPSYWSLVTHTGATHPLLEAARRAFGENPDYGTEPDLLIETADTLVVVEAKLGSANETKPTHVGVLSRYQRAANGWYATVFSGTPQSIAVEEKLYQLMRCWLLGSWMAKEAGKRFVLVNLVAEASDASAPSRFGAHIVASEERQFERATWERIRELIRGKDSATADSRTTTLVEFLDHKSLGYDSRGKLQAAFATRVDE